MTTRNTSRDGDVKLCVLHGERVDKTEAEVLAALAEPLRKALDELPIDSPWRLPLTTFEREASRREEA